MGLPQLWDEACPECMTFKPAWKLIEEEWMGDHLRRLLLEICSDCGRPMFTPGGFRVLCHRRQGGDSFDELTGPEDE